jgi:hypothetical protein
MAKNFCSSFGSKASPKSATCIDGPLAKPVVHPGQRGGKEESQSVLDDLPCHDSFVQAKDEGIDGTWIVHAVVFDPCKVHVLV